MHAAILIVACTFYFNALESPFEIVNVYYMSMLFL